MSIDINNQQILDGDIIYYWWCQLCNGYHSTPWCPNDCTDDSHKDVSGEKVLMYDLCPFCGQEICR